MIKPSIKVAALAFMLAVSSMNAAATDTNLGSVNVPLSTGYGSTFASATGSFLDNYTFTISGASADAVSTTIDLGNVFGISGLQARFYEGTPAALGSLPLETSWVTTTTVGTTTLSSVILNPINLAAGTYTLQVGGTVFGTSGGSYSGVLNLAPVPEPETYTMLLGGLGLLGFMAGRRKKEQV